MSGHAEQRGAVLREQAGFLEAIRIYQRFHSFARRQLAAVMLLFQPLPAAAQHRFAGAFAQLDNLLLHGMNGHNEVLFNPYFAGATVTLCDLPLYFTS